MKTETSVEKAIAGAKVITAEIPNTTSPQPKNLREKYAAAFTYDNFKITL